MTLTSLRQTLALPLRRSTTTPALRSRTGTQNVEDGFDMVPLPPFTQAGSHAGQTTVLAPLPRLRTPKPRDAQAFRCQVAEIQINQGHKAYSDTWLGQIMGARAAPNNSSLGMVKDTRMATNAGQAVVRLTAEGIVATGIVDDLTGAKALLAALRSGSIIDGSNCVSRGYAVAVTTAELDKAVIALQLSNTQHAMLRDIIDVNKFIYDFGVRELRQALDVDLCCGSVTFTRKNSWTEWGSAVRHLFDVETDPKYAAALQQSVCNLRR